MDDDRAEMLASGGDRLVMLLESFERLTGDRLAESPDALWTAARAVVAHGTEAPPLFFYANRTALDLFRMDARAFIGLPSHESAEPALRDERAAMFARLERDDIIDDYSGVRIAATGRRFRIERAFVWNLRDAEGNRHGQAATFAEWSWL